MGRPMIDGTLEIPPRFVEERRWGAGEKKLPVKWVPSRKLKPSRTAPQVPFEQGLADVVQWYRDNRAWWEPLKERAAL